MAHRAASVAAGPSPAVVDLGTGRRQRTRVTDHLEPADLDDARFRALFDHAPVGVALCSPGGTLADVNPTFVGLLTAAGFDLDAGLDDLAELAVDQPADQPVDPAANQPADAGEDRLTPRQRWRAALDDVVEGRRENARIELVVPPREPMSDDAARWLQAIAVRVVLGERVYLLVHLDDVTHRRQAEAELLRLALHDGLTGLANRTLLGERLDEALARSLANGVPVGVLYLDLDGFKNVNDSLGHAAGDELLVSVAERLCAVLRAGDTAGRLGGDEFLVIARDVADEAALAEVIRRVQRTLDESVVADDRQVQVRASIGAVLSRPGETADSLVRRADAAMYVTKRARRRAARRRVPTPADAVQLALLTEQAAVAQAPRVPAPSRRT